MINNKGVTPVIAVILLVAITVVLAAVVYIMINNMVNPNDKAYEDARFTSQINDNGDYLITVSHTSGEIPVGGLYYTLIDNDGISQESGEVINIHRIEPALSDKTVSFWDVDTNGDMSLHDKFYIQSVDNGGLADSDYEFRVSMGSDTIGMVTLN